jgi:hypothetical protein
MTRCTQACLSDGSDTHEHLTVQPPLIEPRLVGPAGRGAGFEPEELPVDAVELLGVVTVEVGVW